MIEERRKIEFAAEVIGGFRGLPLMLYGLAFLIFTILNYLAELRAQRNYGKDITFILMFFLACLVFVFFIYPKIKTFYLKKYGQTKAKFAGFTMNLIILAPVLLTIFAGGAMDARYVLPLNTPALFIGLLVFVMWWLNYRGVSNAVLYLSAILLASSLLDWEKNFLAFTVLNKDSTRALFYRSVCDVFCGITYVVMGATDYWFMTKTLKPVTREEEVYESV